MINLSENNIYLIIDFDSTFVRTESLEDLIDISLAGDSRRKEVIGKIKKITDLGMEGKISFPESLGRRFDLLSANRKHVEVLAKDLKNKVSRSIEKNKDFFQKNGKNIFIISGGFRDYILPVAREFGIPDENVLANDFIFDSDGKIEGFDKDNFLAQEKGKVKQIKALNLDGRVVVLGDGYTDYEIRKKGLAREFVAFGENVKRKKVIKKADYVVENFDEFLDDLRYTKISTRTS